VTSARLGTSLTRRGRAAWTSSPPGVRGPVAAGDQGGRGRPRRAAPAQERAGATRAHAGPTRRGVRPADAGPHRRRLVGGRRAPARRERERSACGEEPEDRGAASASGRRGAGAAVVALDPLRDPVIDRVGHEAGHLAGMAWFGYSANLAQFALRWADHGHFGAFDGVRRTTGDPKREPRDRSTIAALGPVFGGTALDDPSAAADRRSIDLNVTDGWNLETWRWLAAKRARELARDRGVPHPLEALRPRARRSGRAVRRVARRRPRSVPCDSPRRRASFASDVPSRA
jgi:hypothetical protein